MASDTDLPEENAEAPPLAEEAGVEQPARKAKQDDPAAPASALHSARAPDASNDASVEHAPPSDATHPNATHPNTARPNTARPNTSRRTQSGHLRLVTLPAERNAPDPALAPAPQKTIVDPDLDLVERAKGGDQRAFATLFDRHHGRVFAMCCRLLRDRVEVEDAVQHAFLEAWRCLHKFEGRSKFSTWITRIAIHTCLGIRRRLKRMFLSEDANPVEIADDDGQWGSAPMAPDEGAAHHARKRAVDDVLQMLSGKKRVVFVLAELEGMTAPEIAEILQIPDATVRTRLFHARKEFAKAVEAHPGFSDLFGGAS